MPTAKPVTGLLSTYLAACAANGWDPDADVRMEDPDDELTDDERAALEALTPEQIQALNDMSDEDFTALDALSDDDLAKLRTPAQDPTRRLRNEAARRRNELKPWKAIARDYELTPEQVREIVEAHLDDDDEADDKSKRKERTKRGPDRTRDRDRTREAEQRANAKIVKAEVKSFAADLFQDPGDAHLFLDLDKYEVDEDGDLLDPDELLDDLSEVLERKPHLAKRERKGPKPLGGQGRRDATKSTGMDAGRARARARLGKSDNGDS